MYYLNYFKHIQSFTSREIPSCYHLSVCFDHVRIFISDLQNDIEYRVFPVFTQSNYFTNDLFTFCERFCEPLTDYTIYI